MEGSRREASGEGPEKVSKLVQELLEKLVEAAEKQGPFHAPSLVAKNLAEMVGRALSEEYVYVVARARKDLFSKLTLREKQTMHLHAEGLDGPAAAEQMKTKATTVSTHMRLIHGKLGIHSRAQLALLSLFLEDL